MATKVRSSDIALGEFGQDWRLLKLQILKIIERLNELGSSGGTGSVSSGGSSFTLTGNTDSVVTDQIGTTLYLGRAAAGSSVNAAVWQIVKVTYLSGAFTVLFANGDINYDNVWSNRTSIGYSAV